MQFPLSIPFYFGQIPNTDASGCWVGTSSAFERKLLTPLPSYALEQLRLRFLYVVTATHDYKQSARAALQMSFETEVGAILTKQVQLASDVMESKVCPRRRFIEIDKDMQLQRFLIGPALDELEATPNLPAAYMDLIRRYLSADYPRYRVSAISVALCLAAVLLVP